MDPYSDLILTAVEMAQFIAEVDEELAAADTSSDREFLKDARRLAERCAAGPSMELHLVGD
ncbi:hypothetical protein [Kribbella sp. NPDC055071]